MVEAPARVFTCLPISIRSKADDRGLPTLECDCRLRRLKLFVDNRVFRPTCHPTGVSFPMEASKILMSAFCKFRHDNIAHNDLATAQVQIVPPGARLAGKETTACCISWEVTRHVLDLRTFPLIWDTIGRLTSSPHGSHRRGDADLNTDCQKISN